jgi:hypothetical protein
MVGLAVGVDVQRKASIIEGNVGVAPDKSAVSTGEQLSFRDGGSVVAYISGSASSTLCRRLIATRTISTPRRPNRLHRHDGYSSRIDRLADVGRSDGGAMHRSMRANPNPHVRPAKMKPLGLNPFETTKSPTRRRRASSTSPFATQLFALSTIPHGRKWTYPSNTVFVRE